MKKIEDNDIALITRYFDLDLSEKEMEAFDQRFQNDPDFAIKVTKYRLSIGLIKEHYPNQEQEERSEKWKQLISENPSVNQKQSWKLIAAIAATIVILVTSWYFSVSSSEINLKVLAKNAWDKNVGFSDYLVRNNVEDNPKKLVINAFKSYKKKNYQSVLEQLKDLDNSYRYYEDVLLIKALATYKTGHSKKALQILDSLKNYPSEKLSKEAQWYMGLIYLDQDDLIAAKRYLVIPNHKDHEIQLSESSY
ncbi:hypothetical protein [Aquimarina sp. 433]